MSQKRSNENNIKDITASLGRIVRYSLNDDFRNKCFDLVNVDCTQNFETEIAKRLENTFNCFFPRPPQVDVRMPPVIPMNTAPIPSTPVAADPSELNFHLPTPRTSLSTLRSSQNSSERVWNGRRHRVEPYGTLGQASMSQLLISPHSSRGRYYSQNFIVNSHTNFPFSSHPPLDILGHRKPESSYNFHFFDSDD